MYLEAKEDIYRNNNFRILRFYCKDILISNIMHTGSNLTPNIEIYGFPYS